MTIPKQLLDDLAQRRARLAEGGGRDKIEQRHAKGLLSARERLGRLFDAGTFQESGAHIRHTTRYFGMADKELPADGVVVGTGFVDGRQVAAFSQDFTVGAGTLGKKHADKICNVLDFALANGVPVVAFQDSGGARIQEGVDALAGFGGVFYRNVAASGVVPQIACILGPCAGGAAYSPALMDFIVMTRENAHLFITGPEVIKAVTGKAVSMEEVGGAAMHASVSGNVHFVAEDDADAVRITKKLLSYLPANNTEDPPHRPYADLVLEEDPAIDELIPESSSQPMDMRAIIARIVDGGELFEVHAGWAQNMIVGFARIAGLVVGIVANNPMVGAGAIDINASDKAARFIRFCNIFNIPLVNFVDVPGFRPGIEQERGGIIRHGAKVLFAYASTTTPKITVITRKAYGGAYIAMCSNELGADFVFAWPSAEIAVMGAEGAVNLLYRKELKEAEDRAALASKLATEYRAEFASPYLSAGQGYVGDVIRPSETRAAVALALHKTRNKRQMRPPKKHGDIPL